MAAPYLTAAQIEDRLSNRFEIEATITDGRADMASDEVDASAPFIGRKLDLEQERPFPRSINPDGTQNVSTEPPSVVLDRVALLALRSSPSAASSAAYTPAITSESIGSTSRSYASPKLSEVDVVLESNWASFQPYLLKMGQRAGVRDWGWRTHESYPDAPLAMYP